MNVVFKPNHYFLPEINYLLRNRFKNVDSFKCTEMLWHTGAVHERTQVCNLYEWKLETFSFPFILSYLGTIV